VQGFLVHLSREGPGALRGSTFDQYVSTMGKWHAERGLPKPAEEPGFARVLEGCRRRIGRAGRQVVSKKTGLTLPQLRIMLRELREAAARAPAGGVEDFRCKRDAAILGVGFFGWLRGGELTNALVRQLTSRKHELRFWLPGAKTDQKRHGHMQVIAKFPRSGLPVGDIVDDYLAALRLRSLDGPDEPLFPGIAHNRIQAGRTMGRNVVTSVVRAGVDTINRLAEAAGAAKRLSRAKRAGHSLRRGGYNHGVDSGMTREHRRVYGRWKQDKSQDAYFEWRAQRRLAVAEML